MSLPRLSALNSAVLVVDMQERLLDVMPNAPGLVRDIGFLLDVANILKVPTVATEQYPRGLGADVGRAGPSPERTIDCPRWRSVVAEHRDCSANSGGSGGRTSWFVEWKRTSVFCKPCSICWPRACTSS